MINEAGQEVLVSPASRPRLRDRFRAVFKYGAALGGQASLSLFHFGLNVVLVRHFEPHDYGVFALAFVAAVLGSSVVNALTATPVSVYTPGLPQGRRRRYLESLLASVNLALVGVILLVTLLVTVAMSFPPVTIVAFSAFVAMYSARQYSRSFGYARLSPQVALFGDLCYVGVSGVVLGAAALGGGEIHLPLALGALAVGNLVAMLLEFWLLTRKRGLRLVQRWRSFKRYGFIWQQSRWALIGAVTTLIAAQAHSFLVSLVKGPAAYAPLAAGYVLFGPIRIALQSWLAVMRPDMAVAIANKDRGLLEKIRKTSVWVMLLGMAVFATLLASFWEPISAFLYANRYGDAPMGWIVAGWCLVTAVSIISVTPSGLLQALKSFRVLAMGTVFSSALSLFGVALFLSLYGPAWSLLGVLMAEIFLAWYLMRAVNREVRKQW